MMTTDDKDRLKTIMDREKLMTNSDGCPACGQKFNLKVYVKDYW